MSSENSGRRSFRNSLNFSLLRNSSSPESSRSQGQPNVRVFGNESRSSFLSASSNPYTAKAVDLDELADSESSHDDVSVDLVSEKDAESIYSIIQDYSDKRLTFRFSEDFQDDSKREVDDVKGSNRTNQTVPAPIKGTTAPIKGVTAPIKGTTAPIKGTITRPITGTVKGGTVKGGTVKGETVKGGTVKGGTVKGETVKGGTVKGGTVKDAVKVPKDPLKVKASKEISKDRTKALENQKVLASQISFVETSSSNALLPKTVSPPSALDAKHEESHFSKSSTLANVFERPELPATPKSSTSHERTLSGSPSSFCVSLSSGELLSQLGPGDSVPLEPIESETALDSENNSETSISHTPISHTPISKSLHSENLHSHTPISKSLHSENLHSHTPISQTPNSKTLHSQTPNSKTLHSQTPNSKTLHSQTPNPHPLQSHRLNSQTTLHSQNTSDPESFQYTAAKPNRSGYNTDSLMAGIDSSSELPITLYTVHDPTSPASRWSVYEEQKIRSGAPPCPVNVPKPVYVAMKDGTNSARRISVSTSSTWRSTHASLPQPLALPNLPNTPAPNTPNVTVDGVLMSDHSGTSKNIGDSQNDSSNYGSRNESSNYGSRNESSNYGSRNESSNYGSRNESSNYGSRNESSNYDSRNESSRNETSNYRNENFNKSHPNHSDSNVSSDSGRINTASHPGLINPRSRNAGFDSGFDSPRSETSPINSQSSFNTPRSRNASSNLAQSRAPSSNYPGSRKSSVSRNTPLSGSPRFDSEPRRVVAQNQTLPLQSHHLGATSDLLSIPSSMVREPKEKSNLNQEMFGSTDDSIFANVNGSPLNGSPVRSNDLEKGPHRRGSYYSWSRWAMMMCTGLLAVPVFFLLTLGVFDNGGFSRSGMAEKNGFSSRYNRRYSPAQKTASALIGMFWLLAVFSMIAVGFTVGLRRNPI